MEKVASASSRRWDASIEADVHDLSREHRQIAARATRATNMVTPLRPFTGTWLPEILMGERHDNELVLKQQTYETRRQ